MPDTLQQATRTGFGRFLIAVYAVFAVAATSRRMVLFGGLDQSEDKQDTFVLAWPSGQ